MKDILSRLSVSYQVLRNPKLGRDNIVCFQNRQLRHLISHAYENVPYYRRLFDQNRIKPNDIQSVADLSIIPITSKKDLQSLPPEDLVAQGLNPKSLIAHRTSGSSGEPFTIRHGWLERRILFLFRLRAMLYHGQRSTDRVANIGLVRPLDPNDNRIITQILQAMHLYRRVRINRLLPPEKILSVLRHYRPDILTGSPGVLSRVAQILDYEDRLLIRLRCVRVNGEVLTLPMRRQISEAFKVPVFDTYGSREFSLIAWECMKTGELHTCDDSVVVEIVKDGRPVAVSERGEVVGTNLHSFAMPFIRYRLGDMVTKGFETCPCGQPFSTIRLIQGRMLDYFPLPHGRMIHPYEISLLFIDAPWLRQYQLTQEREDLVVLRVVPHGTPTTQELAQLEESVIAVLGQGVEFQVILVPEIRLEPSGKFRVSRSLVRSAYDAIDWNQPHNTKLRSNSGHNDKTC
jgi:phenylacetate-CoA ligase